MTKAGASSTHSKRWREIRALLHRAKRMECVQLAGALTTNVIVCPTLYRGVPSMDYTCKPTTLLPLPFRRGEGWGEGSLCVVYAAVSTVNRTPLNQDVRVQKPPHQAWPHCFRSRSSP